MSSPYQKRAAALAAEIKVLQRTDGSYEPDDLITWAKRHPKSILYASFEWNDAAAGAEHRLEQARKILRQYVVVVRGSVKPVSLISVTSRRTDDNKGSYLTQPAISANKVLRAEVLEQTKVQLRGLKEKYGWLTELNSVWSVIK